MKHERSHDKSPLESDSGPAIVDVEEIPSAVLKRLIKEVRAETLDSATAYNRVHNRHNRGR